MVTNRGIEGLQDDCDGTFAATKPTHGTLAGHSVRLDSGNVPVGRSIERLALAVRRQNAALSVNEPVNEPGKRASAAGKGRGNREGETYL